MYIAKKAYFASQSTQHMTQRCLSHLLGSLLILTTIAGCNSDEALQNTIEALRAEQETLLIANSIADVKLMINEEALEGNIVTDLQTANDSTSILIEGDKVIRMSAALITNSTEDPASWELTINFSDGSEFSTPYLGERLAVCPDCITLNPYRNAPLAALIQYESILEEKAELVVIGQDGPGSNMRTTSAQAQKIHQIEVLGLYPDYANEVLLIFKNKNGFTRDTLQVSIQTAALEGVIPEFHIAQAQANPQDNEVFFVNFKSTSDPMWFVDNFGKVRGYITGFANTNKSGFTRLSNGNYLFGNGAEPEIIEFNLMGQKINEWSLAPGYTRFHHDVIELPNGNFVIAADKANFPTIEDILIELDPATGQVVTEWDLNDILPKRYTQIYNEEDWVHINAVIYDERDNTLIVSGQRQGLFKIDWDNSLKWIISPPYGWEGYEQYLFAPVGENFDWNWTQHAPLILPNGNLFFWENGFGRNFTSDEQYSRAVEVAIDTDNLTIEEVWSYGKERGDELFSPIVGDVDYLPETDTRLLTSGALSLDQVYEDSATITRFWRTEQVDKARIVEVDEAKNVVFEMVVRHTGEGRIRVYRSEKMRFYD